MNSPAAKNRPAPRHRCALCGRKLSPDTVAAAFKVRASAILEWCRRCADETRQPVLPREGDK